jgi:two-component system, LytTR family, sensor kinase
MFSVRHRYVFILLLGVYSYINILFTTGSLFFGFSLPQPLFIATIIFLVLMVWEANRFLQVNLNGIRVFFKTKINPLIIHFVLSLIVVAAIATATTLLLSIFHPFQPTTFWISLKLSLGFSFRINLFLHCINAIVFYMNKYKVAQVEAEQLKKQTVEARFDALRSQINPHFLFNSLNVLSSLVYRDPDTSAKFIEQLSNVYRYLLYNQDQKLIPLREELDFMNSYYYLLKIRFQENLNLEYEIPDSKKNYYIAPATLQLLIENAIKHNIVSKKNPLAIRIYVENGKPEVNRIVVENNLQPKPVQEVSTRLGLKNIKSRYTFLAGKESVEVITQPSFIVKVPLIKIASESETA